MARVTNVSPYRSGAPRFGTKGHADDFDNSVKVSYLSPEELEAYRNGERGGAKVFMHDDYLKMVEDGLSKQQIADKMGISIATLYNRIKKWESPYAQNKESKKKSVAAAVTQVKDSPAVDDKQVEELKKQLQDVTANYSQLLDEYNMIVKHATEMEKSHTEKCSLLKQQIEGLKGVNAACGDVENELFILREENNTLKKLLKHYL